LGVIFSSQLSKTLVFVLALPSSAHGHKDVDGGGWQNYPDRYHDVVKRNVVAVLQLEAEHDLSG